MEYSNSQIREIIGEYIHSERDRAILSRRLIDGISPADAGLFCVPQKKCLTFRLKGDKMSMRMIHPRPPPTDQ